MPRDRSLLLVDDDETTRELLELLLQAEGWTVRSAESGDAAVLCLDNFAPAVILSDLQMPGLSGASLAEALRAGCSHTPLILAMTATPDVAPPAGFDAMLEKPFPPEAVLAKCEELWSAGDTTSDVTQSEAVTQTESEPVLSRDVLERLQEKMPSGRLRAFFEFALADAQNRVHRMAEAAGADDDVRLRGEAHALKGSCGMIGAMHLRSLAMHVEDHGRSAAVLTASNPFAQFDAAITDIRHILLELLPE